MQAMVGQEAPFDHGRQQMKLLAGLEVTTKAVERTAEAIGGRYRRTRARGDPAGRAVGSAHRDGQADPIPVCADGRHRSAGSEERDRGPSKARRTANRPIPGKPSWDACSPRPTWDEEGYRHPRSRFHHLHWRHRNGRGVWQANLRGSLEARLEPRRKEGRHRRWRGMDLESCRAALSRRDSDRRSVSRPPAPLGPGAQAIPQSTKAEPESLDDGPPGRSAGQGKNRKAGGLAPLHRFAPIPELAEKIRTEADYFETNAERMRYPKFRASTCLSAPASSKPAAKPWSAPAQAVRHVLDRSRRQRHPRSALLPPQRPLRGLLGGAPRRLDLHFYVAHPGLFVKTRRCVRFGSGFVRRSQSIAIFVTPPHRRRGWTCRPRCGRRG